MATLHFVKDGKLANGDRLTCSLNIFMDDAVRAFGDCDHHFTKSAPTINPDHLADDFAHYKHAVLEVELNEVRKPFAQPGFYYLIGLSPQACEEKLRLAAGLRL